MNKLALKRIPIALETGREPVSLRSCDLQQCEATCCYDGVYLQDGEEERLRDVVASAPEIFDSLPEEFIVDGYWNGRFDGRKTATRPYNFKRRNFPKHFSRTRCVFIAPDHKCMLQVLAVEHGLHKWAYKPRSCWLFPLRLVDNELVPPPAFDEPDPDCLGDEYPGCITYTPCGRDRDDGQPWEDCLAEEIHCWKQRKPE